MWGTDISSSGKLDSRGQVSTVSEVDNVRQAIKNRLLTELDVYSSSCDDYGTTLKDMLGKELTKTNIEWIRMEIRLNVLKDPRVGSCRVEYKDNVFKYFYKLLDDDTEYSEEV